MQQTMQATNAGDARRRTAAGRWKMLAVLLVCAAPPCWPCKRDDSV